MKKDFWGKGIPNYNDSDLMTEQDIYLFALNTIIPIISNEGYIILDVSKESKIVPSFLMKKGDKKFFVLVKTAIAPMHAYITSQEHDNLLLISQKHSATPMFAPVEIGAKDHERFDKGIALKYDAFYMNYTGLKQLDL